MRSAVPFTDVRRRRVAALAGAAIAVSSRELNWSGVTVEAGSNDRWEVDDLVSEHHYLAINTARLPLHFEARISGVFRPVVLMPGAAWFCPAGEPFSHRVQERGEFALFTIAPQRFQQFVGQTPRLVRRYGLAVPQLDHLVRALVAEAGSGGPGGRLFVDALTAAAAAAIAGAMATPAAEMSDRAGKLSAAQIACVRAYLEAHLAEAVTIDELAALVELSPSRFMHAFKSTTGMGAHRFHIAIRLERARERLRSGDSVLDVALDLGFVDQSHFTKHFRAAYATTPALFARGRQ